MKGRPSSQYGRNRGGHRAVGVLLNKFLGRDYSTLALGRQLGNARFTDCVSVFEKGSFGYYSHCAYLGSNRALV